MSTLTDFVLYENLVYNVNPLNHIPREDEDARDGDDNDDDDDEYIMMSIY